MADQNVGYEEQPVCKHHQTGCCGHGNQCNKYHSNKICKELVCRNQNCTDRHPRTCKYFARRNNCKHQERCAYAQKENKNNMNYENLKEEVKFLKEEVGRLTNHMKLMIEYNNQEIHQMKEQSDQL